MVLQNSTRKLAANCASGRRISSERFFTLFHHYSCLKCSPRSRAQIRYQSNGTKTDPEFKTGPELKIDPELKTRSQRVTQYPAHAGTKDQTTYHYPGLKSNYSREGEVVNFNYGDRTVEKGFGAKQLRFGGEFVAEEIMEVVEEGKVKNGLGMVEEAKENVEEEEEMHKISVPKVANKARPLPPREGYGRSHRNGLVRRLPGKPPGAEIDPNLGKHISPKNRLRNLDFKHNEPVSAQTSLVRRVIPGQLLSENVRRIMRSLPHSVVVLTTSTSPDIPLSKENSQGENVSREAMIERQTALKRSKYRGITLSSFNTLSISPEPIITFNIYDKSSTLETLKNTRQCLIHILKPNADGAAIADAFSKGGGGITAFNNLTVTEEIQRYRPHLDSSVKIVLPRITSPGVKRVLRCKISSTHFGKSFVHVGDHYIVVAGVREVLGGAGWEEGGFFGLSHADGRYRGVGETIQMEVKKVEMREKEEKKGVLALKGEAEERRKERHSKAKRRDIQEEDLFRALKEVENLIVRD